MSTPTTNVIPDSSVGSTPASAPVLVAPVGPVSVSADTPVNPVNADFVDRSSQSIRIRLNVPGIITGTAPEQSQAFRTFVAGNAFLSRFSNVSLESATLQVFMRPATTGFLVAGFHQGTIGNGVTGALGAPYREAAAFAPQFASTLTVVLPPSHLFGLELRATAVGPASPVAFVRADGLTGNPVVAHTLLELVVVCSCAGELFLVV